MDADTLLLALHAAGITIAPDGAAMRWRGPKGAMTPALATSLKEHKPLLLAVARTINDRERDADWETVRDWALDHHAPIVTSAVHAAGRRLGLAVRGDEWPGTYARRILVAVRVRALLRVFEVAPVVARIRETESDRQEVA